MSKNDMQDLGSDTLPHDVPAEKGSTVLIRDGAHEGTIVVNLGHRGFAFHFLDGVQADGVRPRCVLVELANPETTYVDGYEVEESDWQAALPDDVLVGCDLTGKGYALLGVDEDTEIDERCGLVLWDSNRDQTSVTK